MKIKLVLLVGILMVISVLAGQSVAAQATSEPLLIQSAGIRDQDGTVLYSIFVASGEQSLHDLSLSVTVPEGITLTEAVFAPQSIEANIDGSLISWTVETLEPDTLLGPFTYRVEVNDPEAEIPAALAVQAAWAEGETELPQAETVLEPLAASGSMTFDAAGTLDEAGTPVAVAVGDTGIWLYVPAGAVTEPTTITLERMPVPTGDGAAGILPEDAEETWWCSLISVQLDPAAEITEPLLLVIPTRRMVTPGLAGSGFVRVEDEMWQSIDTANIFISPDGAHTIVDGIMLTNGMQLAVGVNNTTRLTGTVSGATLTTNISDGTSNTVQGYIEQESIIAILIGYR